MPLETTPMKAAITTELVQRFEDAVIDMAFKGSYDPATHADVEAEYAAAKAALNKEIATLRRNLREVHAQLARSIAL